MNESITLAIGSLQNPFTISRLRLALKAASAATVTLEEHQFDPECARILNLNPSTLNQQLSRAVNVLQYQLAEEVRKPNHIRFFGSTSDGEDDSWRIWIVLDKELSAQVLNRTAEAWRAEDVTGPDLAVADIWNSLGLDPSASPEWDISPSGRMFRRRAEHRVLGGHVLITQTGARDV